MLFTVVGDVQHPGMYELPLGFPLSALLFDLAGGPAPGRTIWAVLPGASNAVVTPNSFDVALDFDSMKSVGSGLGAGGFAVYDDTACAVRIAETFTRFLYVESCGQCPPCKLHSGDISETFTRIDRGEADAGDLQDVLVRCSMVTDGQRCGLPDGVRNLVPSLITEFRSEFETHLNGRVVRCRETSSCRRSPVTNRDRYSSSIAAMVSSARIGRTRGEGPNRTLIRVRGPGPTRQENLRPN